MDGARERGPHGTGASSRLPASFSEREAPMPGVKVRHGTAWLARGPASPHSLRAGGAPVSVQAAFVAPFKPSEQGSTMRHIRKPNPPEIVI
jgi:hypothetical protein